MKEWIAIGLGGMFGALLRHGLTCGFSLLGGGWLLLATLTANALGCLAIGALVTASMHFDSQNHWLTLGIRVGLLGGLTTFSSFAVEVIMAWQNERAATAVGLVAAHLTLGLVAVLLGMAVTSQFLSAGALLSADTK